MLYRIVPTATYGADPNTVTQVHEKTLFSNFFEGAGGEPQPVGTITATGGTLIANGVTTVHRTE